MVERIFFDEAPTAHGLLANPRTVVEAAYIEPELPKFAGNPCILTLPPINTRERAIELMLRLPNYNEEMRSAPAHLRPHMAMDVLHFFQPLPKHLKLEGMVSRAIRDGYLDRNPLDPANSNKLRQRLEYFKTHPYAGEHFSTNSSGFIVCGMSGLGKSTSLARILSLYPQLIIHSNYGGKKFTRVQIVMAIVECPKDGSTKGLCMEFFKTIDYITSGETNYEDKYGKETRSTNAMMNSMEDIAKTHLLGILVIDEIQYLNVAKSGGAEEMLNFFVRLVNKIGIPVILVGTYDAGPLLTSTFRQARRGSGQGDVIWDPLTYSTDPCSDWRLYTDSLWEYQYVRTPSPLTEELSLTLHDVSYGVEDLANKIYLAAQIKAIETGQEVITDGMLRSAYRDDFRLMSHIIETLKTGKPELIQKFKDVHRPPIIPVEDCAAASRPPAPPVPTALRPEATGSAEEDTVSDGAAAMSNQDIPAASQTSVTNSASTPATPDQNGKPDKRRGKKKPKKLICT